MFYSMPPVSWSDISYYYNQVGSICVVCLGKHSSYVIISSERKLTEIIDLKTDSSFNSEVQSCAFEQDRRSAR